MDDELKAERLHGYAASRFGTAYTGVWVDHSDHARVKIAAPSDASVDTEELGRRFGLENKVDRVVSRYSIADLRDIRATFEQHARANGARGVHVSGIDVQSARLEVFVEDMHDRGYQRAKGETERRYPQSVNAKKNEAPPFRLNGCSTTFRSCDPQLRGGVWGQDVGNPSSSGDENPPCSLGFLARSSGGTPYMLTAGHCVRAIGLNGSTWVAKFANGGGHQVGRAVNGRYDSSPDVGLISIANTSGWGLSAPQGRIAVWASGQTSYDEWYYITGHGSKRDLMALAEEERTELLGLLRSLTAIQWDAQSLCTQWRVRDVATHVVS